MSGLLGCVIPLNTSIGHNQEENQVSSTSSSCFREGFSTLNFELNAAFASASFCATTNLPVSSYQAGILCPHQSWRLMHQSFIFSSQYLYVAKKRSSGWIFTCPLVTAFNALFA